MSLKVVVNKTTNKVEVTSPGPQGNFYNSFKGNWSSATAYILGDIVFYNGSSYVAIANNTNSQPPSANWSAVAKGIPGGGTTGQIIVKNSSTDYDYSWTNNYTINTTSPLTGGANINTNPTLAINATSDDTANYVVQRDANQSFAIGAVRFDTSSVQTTAVGKLYWDGNETLNLGLGSTGTVTIAVGQEVINYVTNAEATTLNVGEVVYLFGASGDRPSVKRASNASDTTSAKTFGIVAESITAGGAGFVINKGIVSKINTSAYNPGDIIWLGATPGTFTTTKPIAPAHLVFVGVVLRSNAGNGLVYVAPQNGYELEEIHDVLITSKTNGDFLVYESSSDLWKNKQITATAPITYDASTRVIAANAASTSAAGVVQLTDSTSSTSTTTAATPNSVKTAYDLAAAAIPLSQKAAANGVATLDASGLVPTNQLPALAITNTFVVASQAAMLALTAETGDVAVRTDLSKSFILTATPASTLGNWQELLTPPDAVSSVDGRTGTVTLTDKYAQLATANTFTGGLQQIVTANASTGGLLIKASASQTENLQVWQNSSGSNLVGIGGTGGIFINRSVGSSTTGLIVSTGATTNVGIRIDGVASQTGDLQQWRDSNANVLAYVNSAGQAQFGLVNVTSSTIAPNGIYLPAANTLGFATNSAVRLQISSTGNIGINRTASTSLGFVTAQPITGATTAGGISNRSIVQSDVTNIANGFETLIGTAAASFNLTALSHYAAQQGTFDTGSTVTTQYGFTASTNLIGATNNYGFFSAIPSAANRWNFYANGTAANYFAGQTTVGSTSLTLGSGSVAQQFGVVSGAATSVGAVIRGAASQTADLTQWQNSAGSRLVKVTSDGKLIFGSGISTSSTSIYFDQVTTTAGVPEGISWNLVTTNTTSASVLAVRTGGSYATDLYFSTANSGDQTATERMRINSAGTVLVNGFLPAANGIIVKGAASQSADLVQLQNSSGTILDAFDNSGNQRSQAQLIQYGAEGSLLQNVPTRVHPAETLLKQAVWWIDAAHVSASSQTINNLGWGGSALNVTNGSSTSADSNDARYLDWDGINYVYLPGIANNYLSVPDANNLDIAGDIDIRVQVAMDDWTPAAISTFVGKWVSVPANRSYLFQIDNFGSLRFHWSPDGSTITTKDSTTPITFTDGTVNWVRVTFDVDNGAGGNDIRFFTSTNGTTWTQLGSTVTTAGIASMYNSNVPVEIGTRASGGSDISAGKFYRAQILNGIDGVPVLDVDTSQITSGSATFFTALTGQTVTVNRSTSGRKTVCVTNPLWLFGTDDYMEVNNRWLEHTGSNYLYLPGVNGNNATTPDSAALDITGDIDVRVKVALDDWTPGSSQLLVARWPSGAGNRSFYLYVTTFGQLSGEWTTDGTNALGFVSSALNLTDGTVKWVRWTMDVDNGAGGRDHKFYTSDDGTNWTQVGTTLTQAGTTSIFAGNAQLEVGSYLGGSAPVRGKMFRAQVLNGIGGTVAFDANFETGITSNLPTTFTESSANAATVTVNYSGTGYRSAGVIASTYVYPGNPNTFKLSTTSLLDFGASDSFTVLAVVRQFATQVQYSGFVSKRLTSANGGNGYELSGSSASNGARIAIDDGPNAPAAEITQATANLLSVISGVVDRSAVNEIAYINSTASASTSISGVGTLTSIQNLTIGNRTVTAAYNDMEFVAAAIFRRALTASEIAILNNYFQGRVA